MEMTFFRQAAGAVHNSQHGGFVTHRTPCSALATRTCPIAVIAPLRKQRGARSEILSQETAMRLPPNGAGPCWVMQPPLVGFLDASRAVWYQVLLIFCEYGVSFL